LQNPTGLTLLSTKTIATFRLSTIYMIFYKKTPILTFRKKYLLLLAFPIVLITALSSTFISPFEENEWSARRALIFIYTKNLTGKDSSPEKAITQLRAIMDEMEAQNTLRPNHQKAIYKAIDYLKTADNHNFKYFDFYQKYFLPIYRTLPLDSEGTTSDANADGIFDAHFLNPLAFAELEKDTFWNARLELGKLIFHDPLLSGNNKRSCASCHQADKGFTDGLPKSIDFDGTGTVDRNSPTLINAVFARPYLHDLSHPFLERQFHQVLEHPKEFRTKYWEIIRKLNTSPEYVQLFKAAYPELGKINTDGIAIALKTYIASLVALNSDFDKMIRSEMPVNQDVTLGYDIFMGKGNCGTCHFPPLFSGLQTPLYEQANGHAVGVPASNKKPKIADTKDLGAALIPTPEYPAMLYQFKTPSLRNLAHTAPYMHNGVIPTLDEAVDFMCNGGNTYKGRKAALTPVTLTPMERKQLMTFLQSLNDTTFSFNPKPIKLPEAGEIRIKN
jgi:cytochrome c peroxidase